MGSRPRPPPCGGGPLQAAGSRDPGPRAGDLRRRVRPGARPGGELRSTGRRPGPAAGAGRVNPAGAARHGWPGAGRRRPERRAGRAQGRPGAGPGGRTASEGRARQAGAGHLPGRAPDPNRAPQHLSSWQDPRRSRRIRACAPGRANPYGQLTGPVPGVSRQASPAGPVRRPGQAAHTGRHRGLLAGLAHRVSGTGFPALPAQGCRHRVSGTGLPGTGFATRGWRHRD
jgi:hypothetical protein